MAIEGEIRVLGRFSVRRHGREIEAAAFGGGQTRTLVRILVARRGELVSRDALIDALWPRNPPAEPGASLNVLVNRARRALGEPTPLVTGSGGYLFVDDASWLIDAEAFVAAVAEGRGLLRNGDAAAALGALRAALDRWGGEPLPEDAYADWSRGYRATLLRAFQECLEEAATAAIEANVVGEGVGFAQRAVAAEPLREAATLALVRCLAAAGDQAGALAAFDEFRKRLGDELGLEPSADAFALQSRVIRHEAVAAPKTPTPRSPVGAPSVSLSFVGRDAEVDAVLDVLRREPSGVALVAGRSGAGKSRLLSEIAARLDVPIVFARAFSPEQDEPWGLARTLLREAFLLDPEAATGLPPRVAVALADIVPEVEQLEALPPLTIDPASRRALTLRGAIQLLAAVLPDGGALVVDDLQWTDASSLELLALVQREAAGIRLVLAYRPEEVAPESHVAVFLAQRERDQSAVAVRLDALPPTAIARLLADDALADLVAGETDGTPFAVVEVIRALWERSMLAPGPDGTWRVCSGEAMTVATQAASAGQRRAVERRLEVHPPERRELLRLLALVGREVPARVLADAMTIEEALVLESLDALTRSDLVRLGAKGWATAHDLVRETVAGGLESGHAANLHACLARALAGDDADPAELARHARAAGDGVSAASLFARAASQRLDRFANDDAAALAEDGLDLVPADPVSATLLEVRAEARVRQGDLPGARADLRAAMNVVSEGAHRSALLSRMAMLAFGAEDMVRAEELVEVALAAAGADPAARARALAVGALTDMNLNRAERAAARSEEALGLFEHAGDAHGVADILDGRAMGRFLGGDINGALGAFDRVARLFEDAGDLLRVVTPRSTRGHALLFAGRADDALGETTDALELARTLGHPEQQSYALWHRSEALAALGRTDEAHANATEALVLAEALGHRGWTATAWRALGIARSGAGDVAGAEDAFRQSLALSEHLSLFASWASSRLAMIRVNQGDIEAAASFVAQALAEGPELAQYEARLAAAELAWARGDADTAATARDALARAEAGGHLVSVARLAVLASAAGGA